MLEEECGSFVASDQAGFASRALFTRFEVIGTLHLW
jgi:hypothetical protein